MPQISPMNWPIILTTIFWISMSILSIFSSESFKNSSQKTMKSFMKKWNW